MEGNVSQLQFCRYQATLGNVDLVFWATADGELVGPQGRRVDASLGATTTGESEALPPELFVGQDVGENLRCGNVWEAVPALIKSLGPLLDRLSSVAPMPPRVLELGAGMGLPGLWAAAQGAEVVLTESNLAVLELLERNARLLGDGAPAVRALDWSALPGWICGAEFDLVVASDVLYDRAAIEPRPRPEKSPLRTWPVPAARYRAASKCWWRVPAAIFGLWPLSHPGHSLASLRRP